MDHISVKKLRAPADISKNILLENERLLEIVLSNLYSQFC